MVPLRLILIPALFGLMSIPLVGFGQTFVVGDRGLTVNNTNIKDDDPSAGGADLTAGDSISFQGDITVVGAEGVFIDPVLSGLSFTVKASSSIQTSGLGFTEGILIGLASSFDGTLTNLGNVQSASNLGIVFGGDLNGVFVNDGTVEGFAPAGVLVNGALNGRFENSGTIRGVGPSAGVILDSVSNSGVFINSNTITGAFDGVRVGGNFSGSFENTGTITGQFEDGVDIDDNLGGTFVNRGTINGFVDGIFVNNDVSGSLLNNGTIVAQNQDGISVGNVSGSLVNSGSITAGIDGVFIFNDVTGSFSNSATITGGADGVLILDDFEGTFVNTGSILGQNEDGVEIGDSLRGMFINRGTIIGGEEGIQVGQDLFANSQEFTGTLTNYGSITGGDDGLDVFNVDSGGVITNRGSITGGDDGIDVDGDLTGRIDNFGTVRGVFDGVDTDGLFSGDFFNCGIVEGGQFGFLVSVGSAGTGTFHNHGGRVQGGFGAISLQDGNGTVILSGPSHIIGSIDGGGGTGDVLRFQDMRGVSAEKEAELLALAASDPNTGTITLFGETINWLNIEDIQADGSTLESYESLFAGTGLGGYGSALDNLSGLNDPLREFLKALNDVALSDLSEAASNSSGQTLRNAMADLRRERDTNFYHLFSNQFSSLRGEVSGGESDLAVRSQGFLSQEVEIGATVQIVEPEVSTWVTSYVGSGNQNANSARQSADYDQTSILFGRGKQWNEETWIGWFGGYSRSQGTADSFGSSLENDAGWFGLNAQFRRGSAFATLVGGIGFQDIETNRIDFLGSVHEGDTEALGAFVYAQFGKDMSFGEEGKGKWTPYAGFTFGGDSVSSYSENGPVGSALRFQDDTETIFQTVLGVSVSGYEELKKGWLRPRADLAWWHSYGEDSFGANLANSTFLNSYKVVNPDANENRGVLQVGIEFGLDHLEDWTFEAGYFGVVGEDDYNSHGATLGARVEF